MQYCSACGNKLVPLSGGGCGGRGGMDGCSKCDAVFVQTSGGWLPTSGGEHYQLSEWGFKELSWHLAKEIKIWHESNEKTWRDEPNPHHNKWRWGEVGYGEIHYFDTKEEAETWLKVYIQQLQDALGWPNCDKCGQMGTKEFGLFRCKPCDQIYIDNTTYGSKAPPVWTKADFSDYEQKLAAIGCHEVLDQ